MEAHPAEGRSGDRAAAPSPAAAASDDAPSYINPAADDIVEQTLGREPWVHESLATSATGASDFVFLDDGKFSRQLDDYCDPAAMKQAAKPLVLAGPAGSGKTSLLAAWVRKRRASMRRARRLARHGTQEHILFHSTTASRQSADARAFYRRVLTELRAAYGVPSTVRAARRLASLPRTHASAQIPASEDRLSWEFPRGLESAAQRGRIILVVDSADLMGSARSGGPNLRWLPSSFPASVRVILSVSMSNPAPQPAARPAPQPDSVFLTEAFDVEGEDADPGSVRTPLPNRNAARTGTGPATARSSREAQLDAELSRRGWRRVTLASSSREALTRRAVAFLALTAGREPDAGGATPEAGGAADGSILDGEESEPLALSAGEEVGGAGAPVSPSSSRPASPLLPGGSGAAVHISGTVRPRPTLLLPRGARARLLHALAAPCDGAASGVSPPAASRFVLLSMELAACCDVDVLALVELVAATQTPLDAVTALLQAWERGLAPSEERSRALTQRFLTPAPHGQSALVQLALEQWNKAQHQPRKAPRTPSPRAGRRLRLTGPRARSGFAAVPRRGRARSGVHPGSRASSSRGSSPSEDYSFDEEDEEDEADEDEEDYKERSGENKEEEETRSGASAVEAGEEGAVVEQPIPVRLGPASSVASAVESAARCAEEERRVSALREEMGGVNQLPPSLTGGVPLPGLGPLLGRALALIRVSWGGLREEELWAMLRHLQHYDVADAAAAAGVPFLPAKGGTQNAGEATASVATPASTPRSKPSKSGPSRGGSQGAKRGGRAVRGSRSGGLQGGSGGSAEAASGSGQQGSGPVLGPQGAVHGAYQRRKQLRRALASMAEDTRQLAGVGGGSGAVLPPRELARLRPLPASAPLSRPDSAEAAVLSSIAPLAADGRDPSTEAACSSADAETEAVTQLAEAAARAGATGDSVADEDAVRRGLHVPAAEAEGASAGGQGAGGDGAPGSSWRDSVPLLLPVAQLAQSGAVAAVELAARGAQWVPVLTPASRKLLVRVLRALGVVFVRGVFMLPSDAKAVAGVVERRFVDAVPGGRARWHRFSALFWRKAPVGSRRTEELPWHLEQTRAWPALRGVLMDLHTFRIMWTLDRFRDQLFRLWHMLNTGEGAPDTHVVATSLGSSPEAGGEGEGEIEGEGEKLRRFDVTEDLNAALEAWVHREKPSNRELADTIFMIAEFLHDFAAYESSVPELLHAPVNWRSVKALGAELPDLGLDNQRKRRGQAKEGDHPTTHYFLRRWLWIQFPWIVLGASAKMQDAAAGESFSLDDDSSLPIRIALGTADSRRSGSRQSKARGAASTAGEGAAPGTADGVGEGAEGDAEATTTSLANAPVEGSGYHARTRGGGGSFGPGRLRPRESSLKKGFWRAKKIVPRDNVGKASRAKVRARVRTSSPPGRRKARQRAHARSHHGHSGGRAQVANASDGGEHPQRTASPPLPAAREGGEPEAGDGTQTREGGQSFADPATSPRGTGLLSRARRTRRPNATAPAPKPSEGQGGSAGEEIELKASESLPSLRSAKHGPPPSAPQTRSKKTLPRVSSRVEFLAKPHQRVQKAPSLEDEDSASLHLFEGRAEGGDGQLVEPPVATAHRSQVPAHLQAYPMTEWDAQKAEMRARLRRLRRQHDELSQEARARGKQLDDLRTTLERRRQQDAFTESCISAGEAMMVELEKRLHRLHHALTGARRLEAFYRKVELLCNENSPRPDAHVSVIEKRLEASRLSLRDTEQRRRAARYTLRHLKTGELPRMKQELERAHTMHRKVLNKLRSLRDAQRRQVQEKEERREKRRKLSKQIQGQLSEQQEQRQRMTEEAEAEEAEQLRATQASHAERVNAYAAAFQRIRAATGIEDPHEVLEKFLNREGTAQSLADQREAYETRLEELQRQRSQLSREIEDTEVAAASVTGRDTVALDEERLAAEARVAALREKRAQTRSLLKDVKLGTAHVAGILGVHGGMSADGGGAVRDADLPAHVERCRRRVASLAQQVRRQSAPGRRWEGESAPASPTLGRVDGAPSPGGELTVATGEEEADVEEVKSSADRVAAQSPQHQAQRLFMESYSSRELMRQPVSKMVLVRSKKGLREEDRLGMAENQQWRLDDNMGTFDSDGTSESDASYAGVSRASAGSRGHSTQAGPAPKRGRGRGPGEARRRRRKISPGRGGRDVLSRAQIKAMASTRRAREQGGRKRAGRRQRASDATASPG